MPKPKSRGKGKRSAQPSNNDTTDGHHDKRIKQVQSDTSGTMSTVSHGFLSKTTSPTTASMPAAASHPTMTRVFQLKTGVPILPASNPPSVVAVNRATVASNEVNLDHESKTWFEACQRNGRMDNEAMLAKDIGAYVRYELFPKLKFIMNSKQLNYSSDKTSICGLICKAMGLLEEKAAVSWWERYKDMIADVLNAKRADVTGALKRAFLRKS